MPDQPGHHKRHWRPYKTANGNEPVRDFLSQLSDSDVVQIVVAMKLVADEEEDFLDELIAERTKNNPDFPKLVEVAV